MLHCYQGLLCWINPRVREFPLKLLLLFPTLFPSVSFWENRSQNDFRLILSEVFRIVLQKYIRKIFKFWQFWERPQFDISEYAFKKKHTIFICLYLQQRWSFFIVQGIPLRSGGSHCELIVNDYVFLFNFVLGWFLTCRLSSGYL